MIYPSNSLLHIHSSLERYRALKEKYVHLCNHLGVPYDGYGRSEMYVHLCNHLVDPYDGYGRWEMYELPNWLVLHGEQHGRGM